MSQENVEVVRAQFAATNERDFPRAMSFYAEDVELVVDPDAFLQAGTFKGREAVGQWFADWLTTYERGYRFEIDEARDLGDVILLVARHRGRGRGSGAEVRGETGYLYTVRGGKIVRAELYRSRAEAIEAAGLQHVETVRRGYELYAAGDLEGVADLFSSDAEVAGAGGLGLEDTATERRRGPEGFLRAVEEALEAFDDYTVEPEDFIDAGEAVIVPVRISGRGKVSGATLETRLAHLWAFHSDGKVILGEVYRTVDEAREAARRLG